jgi:hypothetical protein
MTAEELLWEWFAKLLMLGVVIVSYVAVYFIGRERGRQAQRRANVLSVIENAAAVTVAIPVQRRDVES